MQTHPQPDPPAPPRGPITWQQAELLPDDLKPLRYRYDGWTPDRQACFLEGIADGRSVKESCRRAGLSHQSAYAFRRKAAGAAFALGWRAAELHARAAIETRLMARAFEGQAETVTRPDGTPITRHRYDNRLALAMLARLDRRAEEAASGAPEDHAARAIHAGFEEFIDIIRRGERHDPTLYLSERAQTEAENEGVSPLGLAALALRDAEQFLSIGDPDEDSGGDSPSAEAGDMPVDTADLDLADRQGWTNAQWQRAEDAGLVTIEAPSLEERRNPQLPQLPATPPGGDGHGQSRHARHGASARRWASDDPGAQAAPAAGPEVAVWRMPGDQEVICTCFPPPAGFAGLERGTWGTDEAYWRAMTPAEAASARAAAATALAHRRTREDAELQAWFRTAA